MPEPPKWDGNFWTTHVSVSGFRKLLAVSIDTDGANAQPTGKQLLIVEHVGDILARIQPELEAHALAYCCQVESVVNFKEEGIVVDKSRIRAHFAYKRVLIASVDECVGHYYFISCDCDWEIEHGMQFLMDHDQILRCGQNEGMFLWADTDEDYRGVVSRD